ncbi:DUF4956 domain-containing protein [Altererythrobacter arenosus]|uniref:DUF4956 domain-containing protein n=1 Tax=Altererythrobacter arenosus TaxID=3032592 RepID=A0ABY8FV96_9SPHN|nr:DUF4956 domain-containing protein [Altererythrobacter sp. CAU 1644]WFL78926.1 DUF4956 domain-containing protein [Altererythrobacter sp. CAU 1644]
MRVARLFVRLTLFYALVTGIVFAAVSIHPPLGEFLPIGGAQTLLSGPKGNPLESVNIGAERAANLGGSVTWLFVAVAGALLTTLPVTWVYMASRSRKEYDQALVETMIVLPIAVTAIVVMVHNSLALAFSLAGIVGGVRFRNTLKSSGDAIYILLAIGIGLAAGIGALEIALVMTVMFNYAFAFLWVADYGGVTGTHRYLRPSNPEDEVEGAGPIAEDHTQSGEGSERG